ncbi:MAG: two-component regulator propeller domain-containing protein [Leeuwenhoekiella sp.]
MKEKLLLCILFLFCLLGVRGQDYTDSWTGYFSYNSVRALTYGGDRIYAASENAIFTYNLASDELQTITTVNGLSAETISAIYYSEVSRTLFVGYASGLIDVAREGEDVFTIVDIVNKTTLPPNARQINHFNEFNGRVYISTGFGISLYDAEKLEFDDSYFIGENGSRLNVFQTAISDGFIYAATQNNGIRRAIADADDLIDFKNWSEYRPGAWIGVASVNNDLYALGRNGLFLSTSGNPLSLLESYTTVPLELTASAENITVTLPNRVAIYDSTGNNIARIGQLDEFPDTYNSALTRDGEIYLGTQENGLLISQVNRPEIAFQILPEGPLRNDPFNIEAAPNELWVVYGDYSSSFNPFPLKRRGVSHLKEDGWQNIPFEELLDANNLVNIAINPQDSKQVFLSGYNSGLLEINDGVAVAHYDESNSSLQDLQSNPTDVRLNGLAFDRNGNLWINNSRVNEAIVKKTGLQFTGYPIADFFPNFTSISTLTELVIDNQNNVFFGSNNEGLLAFNTTTNTYASFSGEEGGANLPSDDVRALAIDNRGSLWIGTRAGLRILFGPSRIFSEENVQASSIVVLEGDIPVEVLNDQAITAIAVDGSNNKWIGTLASGVFYFSPNGQETLLQFDVTNSPLPTNLITDISIDAESGEVFFATPQGLVSYSGSAVAPSENLELLRAYPNPVRPEYSGVVTIDGLTSRANVKITDVAGNLVYEEVSEGGSIQWDTTAFGRHKVASGVYFILVTGDDALETKIAKLMIIR